MCYEPEEKTHCLKCPVQCHYNEFREPCTVPLDAPCVPGILMFCGQYSVSMVAICSSSKIELTPITILGCQCAPGYAKQGDMCVKESHCTCLDLIDDVERQVR